MILIVGRNFSMCSITKHSVVRCIHIHR
uniref:Uncharacterized protein n=1 Tax=Arundo donax TaxID=35708 RepID=A0A0A8YT30_ARUDO